MYLYIYLGQLKLYEYSEDTYGLGFSLKRVAASFHLRASGLEWHVLGAGKLTSDVSNSTASLSSQTLTGLLLCEEENDDESVLFDIVFSSCGVFLTILLSKIVKSIWKVRTQSSLRQPRGVPQGPAGEEQGAGGWFTVDGREVQVRRGSAVPFQQRGLQVALPDSTAVCGPSEKPQRSAQSARSCALWRDTGNSVQPLQAFCFRKASIL